MELAQQQQYVLWFDKLTKDSGALVGGKSANLGELVSMQMPVPSGFAITTVAFEKFIDANHIRNGIQQLIDNCDVDNTEQLLETSKKVKGLIVGGEYPIDIRSALIENYEALSFSDRIKDKRALRLISIGRDYAIVAVRSSATTEDLPTASFAGQQATFLNVKGVHDILDAVKKCWASLYEPRAIFYRAKRGFKSASISVIVQRMIDSEKAGVMFTTNPSTGADEIIIEACWGVGESLVLGEVQPDNYVVAKDGEILQETVGVKKTKIIRDWATDRTIKVPVAKSKVSEQVLTDDEILQIAEYGKKIEQHYGKPQDIEFCIEKSKIYIVQTRAVTTKAKKEFVQGVTGEPILKGLGVSPGIASGTVRIVHGLEDIAKVQQGDILVTSMTSPDLVPTMSKSAAIITDAGGQTCFDGDTLILTKKGFRKIKDIHEGFLKDESIEILSVDSKTLKTKWKRVVNASKRKGKLIEISVSQTGRSLKSTLKLTEDHKVFTFNEFDFASKKISEIIDGQEMVCSIFKIPDNDFFNDEYENLAYLAGAIFSDGYISLRRTKGNVVFRQKSIPEKSKFISKVIYDFNNAFGTELKNYGTKYQRSVIRNRSVYGEADYFSSSKRLPAEILTSFKNKLDFWCLSANEDKIAKFLAGMIDGDGSISSDKARIHIYSGKSFLAHPIVISCLKLGILPQVMKNREACLNFQLVGDNVEKISKNFNRVAELKKRKRFGYRFFSARQFFEKVIDEINYKGRIKPYVQKNLIIDSEKIKKYVLPLMDDQSKEKLRKIIESDLTMLRVRKTNDIGIDDVFNITVDAKNEEDHNYVVFTKMFTPLVVSNCHAAIVSREMGIPAIVGTQTATQHLADGQQITVDAYRGLIYAGATEVEKPVEHAEEKVAEKIAVPTKTKIKVNLAFAKNLESVAKIADGVGLLRIEHMITMSGVHPAALVEEGRSEEYTQLLLDGIKPIAQTFYPKPVWVRTLDARTDEFRNLQGGEAEPHEDNPMLGWHGVRRSLDQPELLKAEFEAIKQLHAEGLSNVHIMLPFVISVDEFLEAKKIAEEVGLPATCKLGIMIETPAAALTIEDFCNADIAFVSFGTNDLSQLTLGIDRNNASIAKLFTETHPAVRSLIRYVIKICKEHGVETSVCGEAPSNIPEFVEFLVGCGIDSISVNIDAVERVRRQVAKLESS